MFRALLVLAAIAMIALPLSGCTEGRLGEHVGNSCDSDLDCAPRSDCLEGGDFPGGMCSHRCDFDGDCPDYARCVDVSGGHCLLECDDDRDCPADYECKLREREGHGGRTGVCLGD